MVDGTSSSNNLEIVTATPTQSTTKPRATLYTSNPVTAEGTISTHYCSARRGQVQWNIDPGQRILFDSGTDFAVLKIKNLWLKKIKNIVHDNNLYGISDVFAKFNFY